MIKKRVEEAVLRQKERYKGKNFSYNSELPGAEVKRYCILTKDAKECMEEAFERLELSARSYHRILKTARTIADLEGKDRLERKHLCEAISYREPDRKFWGGDAG